MNRAFAGFFLLLKNCSLTHFWNNCQNDETDGFVYIFEFKRDKSAEEALKQIGDMGYARSYAADMRQLIMIGVNFDSKERNVNGWVVCCRCGHCFLMGDLIYYI